MIPSEADTWFTAAELADLALPGLPADKRGINRRADAERWHSRLGPDNRLLVRTRKGRGGGVEFHASLLPGEARIELARRGMIRTAPAEPATQSTAWSWYDSQSAGVKAEAERRLEVVAEIQLLTEAGTTKSAAVAAASASHAVGQATVWNWLRLIDGLPRADWLPALAPRRKGGGAEAEIHPDLWEAFKSDYLRNAKPTLTNVYRRTAKIAAANGLSMPSERTFRRRLEREIPAEVLVLRREGAEALRRAVPANRRTVAELQAMEWVNIDGHKFDVFARTPDGRIVRPMMVAIQDVYSRKILAHRIGTEESAVLTRLAFADLFRDWGIPGHVVLDNGRAFASKWITGGSKTRFRFKIRDEEPMGLLPGLGVKTHFTIPYRGQSKPIERAFRDLCDSIAKHPAFEGAYTGNSPMAKPENYGSRAVEWDRFCAVVAEGIADHNAQTGRRTETAKGRSFDEVFAESYAVAPIQKVVDPAVLRMALLAADQKLVGRQTGVLELEGNRYWHPQMFALRGQRVTVRFDPDNLHSSVHLYDTQGHYLMEAELLADEGFATTAGAKETAKRAANVKRRAKELEAAERLLSPDQVAALQARPIPEIKPEPGVVRPVRHAAATAQAAATKSAASAGEGSPLSVLERQRLGRLKLAAANN
ncbi:transposase domain-containing protein [Erythrobacter sp. WG]|uniref:transposase domain-containing protein n=1 Tax=Erythrobacter sp. WG TaxID=2985510 RepID=UPI00227227FD|nr:transposase domain-containing protein [Erythrobacter sp. WG]MCX9146591.1 Mu transposase C-terminal domain-containing protein [Erythrobacter sp. WG]